MILAKPIFYVHLCARLRAEAGNGKLNGKDSGKCRVFSRVQH